MAMDSICRSSLVDCNKGLTDSVWHQCFAIALPSSFQPLDLDYGGWSILLVAAWRCMSTVTFRSASQTPVQLGATTVSRKKSLFRVAGWQLEASFGGRFLVTFFLGFRKDCVAHTPVGLFILSGSDLCIVLRWAMEHRCFDLYAMLYLVSEFPLQQVLGPHLPRWIRISYIYPSIYIYR